MIVSHARNVHLTISANLNRLEGIQWIFQVNRLLERQIIQPQPLYMKTTTPWVRPFVSFTPNICPTLSYRRCHECITLKMAAHIDAKYQNDFLWGLWQRSYHKSMRIAVAEKKWGTQSHRKKLLVHVKRLTSKASFKTVSFIAWVAQIPFSIDFSMLWWFKLLMIKYLVWWLLRCLGASPIVPSTTWCLLSSVTACGRWPILLRTVFPASVELLSQCFKPHL